MAYSKGEAEGSGETGLFTQMWAGLSQLPEAVKCLGCYYLWVRIKNVCVSAGVGVRGARSVSIFWNQDLIPLEEPSISE